MPGWVATALTDRHRARAARAALCVAVVLLAHGLLWMAMTPAVSPPARAYVAAMQVRQVTPPALPLPVGNPKADAPLSSVTAPRVAAAQRPRPLARVGGAPNTVSGAPTDAAPSTTAAGDPIEAARGAGAADASSPITTTEPADVSPVNIYPTRIPPSTLLRFTLQRGAAMGEASLNWQVDGAGYVLQLQASMPQGRAVEQRSQGGFDEAGVAPVRLADRRGGRDVRAANFQREHGKISFSGPRWEWPLHSGAQDRLSWLVQLVAIAAAAPDALHDGAELSMWVVGARGALSVWRFEVRGREQQAAPSGDALAWRLVREPAHPYDLRIDVWLDPSRGHWPLRLRQTQVPGGEPLEWSLRDEPQATPGS